MEDLKKMTQSVKEMTKNVNRGTGALLAVLTFLTVGLIIASFLVPPTGQIDPSVLKATGEIFAFATLFVVREAIKEGLGVKATHGSTTIEVSRDEDPDNDKKKEA